MDSKRWKQLFDQLDRIEQKLDGAKKPAPKTTTKRKTAATVAQDK